MTENRTFLQKYAMQFGSFMGIYWILKFALFPLGLSMPFLQLLFLFFTACVPFLGYYYVRLYREKICGGGIGFVHAWLFTLFMYMFAALLTSVAHYIYFQFIDHGYIVNTYIGLLKEFKSLKMPGFGNSISQLEDALNVASTLRPIEITMQLISQNVLYGSILAIPTALIVKKKK